MIGAMSATFGIGSGYYILHTKFYDIKTILVFCTLHNIDMGEWIRSP